MFAMAIRTTLAAVLAAVTVTCLSACTSDGSDESTSEPAGNSSTSSPSATASDPTYTKAQNRLLHKSSIDWTGDPEVLFTTADHTCQEFEEKKSIDDAIDFLLAETTLKKRPDARGFAWDIVEMYCPAWAEESADIDDTYWQNVTEYRDYVRKSGYGWFVLDSHVIADATTFCNQGKAGASYDEIASRIRRDYFNAEKRVRDYIDHGFEFMCPQWTPTYAPPAAATDFTGGTYRVAATGKNNIQPGTYAAQTSGDGCYWERNDANGNIIDNYFGNGLRMQVTIYSSDYSFNSNNCGHWKKVG